MKRKQVTGVLKGRRVRVKPPSERNMKIYVACAVEGKSQTDVAREHKLSQSRVSAIVRQARRFLAFALPEEFDGLPAAAQVNCALRERRMRLQWLWDQSVVEWGRSRESQVTLKTHEGDDGNWQERTAKTQVGKIQILAKADVFSKELCETEQLLATLLPGVPYERQRFYDGRWKNHEAEIHYEQNKPRPPEQGQRDWQKRGGGIHYGWWWDTDVDQEAARLRHEEFGTDPFKFQMLSGPPPAGFRGLWPAGYTVENKPLDAEARPLDDRWSWDGGCGREYARIWAIPEEERGEVGGQGAGEAGVGEMEGRRDGESGGGEAACGASGDYRPPLAKIGGLEFSPEYCGPWGGGGGTPDSLQGWPAGSPGSGSRFVSGSQNPNPKPQAPNPESPAPTPSKPRSAWPDPDELIGLSVEEKLKRIPTPPLQPAKRLLRYGIVRDDYGNFREVGEDLRHPPGSLLSIPWQYLTPEERAERTEMERREALLAGEPYPRDPDAIVLYGWGE
jgi:hypothetical protein